MKECKVHNFSSIQGDHMRMRRADDHPCKSKIRPVVFKGEEEIKKTGRKPGQMDSFKSSFKQRRDTILNDEFYLKVGYIYSVKVQEEKIHKVSILPCIFPLRS